jgi:hypothetical protein
LCCLISSLAAHVPRKYRCDGRTAVCQLARWTESRCRTECRKAIWRMLWAEMSDYSSGVNRVEAGHHRNMGKFCQRYGIYPVVGVNTERRVWIAVAVGSDVSTDRALAVSR